MLILIESETSSLPQFFPFWVFHVNLDVFFSFVIVCLSICVICVLFTTKGVPYSTTLKKVQKKLKRQNTPLRNISVSNKSCLGYHIYKTPTYRPRDEEEESPIRPVSKVISCTIKTNSLQLSHLSVSGVQIVFSKYF